MTRPDIGIIGCGNWGKNLLRNFHELGALAALCDIHAEPMEAFLQTQPQATHLRCYRNIEALLEQPDITSVVIATPSHTHAALATKALLAGKHVYVEKPMATQTADAQALVALSQQRPNQVLMIGHLLLYHPAVNRLRMLVQQGHLGAIRYIESDRLNFNLYRNDKSVLWDLAPHDLSMLMHVLDALPLQVVSAHGSRTGTDHLIDVARVNLLFPGGIQGHIHTSWIHPFKQVKLIVRGERYTAIFDDTLPDDKLLVVPASPVFDTTAFDTTMTDYLPLEPLKVECQHFINCIREGRNPKSDADNGLAVVRILEEAERLMEH